MYIDIEHDHLWRTSHEPFAATVFNIVASRLADPRPIVVDSRRPSRKSQVGFAANRLSPEAYARFVKLVMRAGSGDIAFRSILRDVSPVDSISKEHICTIKVELPFWVVEHLDEVEAARILTEHVKSNVLTQQQEETATNDAT